MTDTYDSEKPSIFDRFMCIAFRAARDVGTAFINCKWIAAQLHRSLNWAMDNGNKSLEGRTLDQVWWSSSSAVDSRKPNHCCIWKPQQRKDNRKVAQEILPLRGKERDGEQLAGTDTWRFEIVLCASQTAENADTHWRLIVVMWLVIGVDWGIFPAIGTIGRIFRLRHSKTELSER